MSIGEEKVFLASSGDGIDDPPYLAAEISITNLILGILVSAAPYDAMSQVVRCTMGPSFFHYYYKKVVDKIFFHEFQIV